MPPPIPVSIPSSAAATEHAKDIKPVLDSGYAPAEGEHEGATQVEDGVKRVHPDCKVKRLRHSLPLTPYYFPSQTSAVTTSVSTPVSTVGWMTGAKYGL
jgi:hypothetical protein